MCINYSIINKLLFCFSLASPFIHALENKKDIKVSIRLAKIEEVKILNKMIALSARELSRDDYSKIEIDAAIQYLFDVDTDLVHDKTYYVIEKNGELAGCGGWSRRKRMFGGDKFSGKKKSGDITFLDPLYDPAKIRAFAIHPKFARQGLASLLLTYCEQEALSNGFTRTELVATLPGAKLYAKVGYHAVSEEMIKMPNQVPLKFIHMSKSLLQETKPAKL